MLGGVEMTFWGAYKAFWKNYVNFSGRASRKEYWFVFLWNVIIGSVLGLGLGVSLVGMAASAFSYGNGVTASLVFSILFGGILGVYALVAFIPLLSLAVRRFHDVGLSGWWYGGLYIANLMLGFCFDGWFWSLLSFVISVVILVISALPTDYLKKSANLSE